jgi:Bifunctional DNA primase/polymerase, N-terminal/Primase C terminal 1 (PriCT-1)
VISTHETSKVAAGNELAAAALDYTARGWHVFPVSGKRPLTSHGLKDASGARDQIAAWWNRWPGAGIAVRTGRESGLFVLDVDGDQGGDTLHELERERGELPETVRAETGGGGEHFFFRYPGYECRNTAGQLGPGVDTRADGGFCVVAPSPHPSGRRYTWDVGPDDCELAMPPEWLTAPTRPKIVARPVSEWRELVAKGASAGERNNRCAQLAGHLLSRGVDPYVCLSLLLAWDAKRNHPPLGGEEVAAVVDSIARREARKW